MRALSGTAYVPEILRQNNTAACSRELFWVAFRRVLLGDAAPRRGPVASGVIRLRADNEDLSVPDEAVFREKAREAIRSGKLPTRRPDRTWGGPGTGVICTICGEPVAQDQLEWEFERTKIEGTSA